MSVESGDSPDAEEADGYVCECGEGVHDIIGIVEHLAECSPVRLTAESLSRKERNTLLYVEARIVDNGGKLDPLQMNYEDTQNLKVFKAAGLLEVGEPRRDPDAPREDAQHVESFTGAAWDLVRDCRQLRAYKDDRVDFPVGVDE